MTTWRAAMAKSLTVAIGGSMLACAMGQPPSGSESTPGMMWAGSQEVAVHIENENLTDATVYSVRNQDIVTKTKVGYIPGFTQRDLTFPWIDGELVFIIDFLGWGSVPTLPMAVAPGDSLQLVITPELHRQARR